jgi:transcriptional regulator with XRE-family HTH domain
MENVKNIGTKMKEIRKVKGITLKTLSEYTGLSIGYLSNLERNQNSPTLENMRKICDVLNMTISEILACCDKEEKFIIRAEEREVTENPKYSLTIQNIDFGRGEQIYQYVTIQPNSTYDVSSWRHLYDEIGTVLEGTLEVKIDDEVYLLKKGDSIVIRAQHKHCMYNSGDVPSVSFWIQQKEYNQKKPLP